MLAYILNTIILISLGVVVYLSARALPRISDREFYESEIDEHWIVGYVERLDGVVKIHTEKALRRLRTIILRADDTVSKKLEQVNEEKKKQQNGLEFELSEEAEEERGDNAESDEDT